MSTEDLDEYLKKIEKSLQKARNKELGVDENEGKVRLPPPLSRISADDESVRRKRRHSLSSISPTTC
jgi:actin-related protein 5